MRTKSWIEQTSYDYVTWKALKGDPTDNIKGVPNIGQKRAAALALDPLKLRTFLCVPENSEIYERNVRLIRFHDFKESDWKELVMTTAKSNWEGVRQVFDDYGFKSITNDKSWKKFVQTFENANKIV
jgi:5'-3' exonuclease